MEVATLAAQNSVASLVDFVPDQVETQYYKVRRGDNLGSIARKYRTSVAYLRELNDFSRKKTIRVGQKIVVPDRTPLQERKSTKEKKKSSSSVTSSKYYVVKKGDSLASIADKYNLSVIELSKHNNITRKSKLRAGVRLAIPKI